MNDAEIDYEVNKINDFKIQHPTLKTALDVVKNAVESVSIQRKHNQGEIPAHYRPQCGVIVGDAGSGKTTFCNFVKDALPKKTVTNDGFKTELIPCVYVSIANMNTPKTVTSRILGQFGQTMPARASEHDLLIKLKTLFSTCQTSILLLDEIHEILPGVGRDRVMAWLKTLVNETRVSVFVAGTEPAKSIINANAELSGRFMNTIQFHYMRYSLSSETSEFALYIEALCRKIEQTLSFESVFKPTSNDFGQLFLSTSGNLRSISTLFIEGARVALKSKSESLLIAHLDKAFNKSTLVIPNSYRGKSNPFNLVGKELNNQLKMVGVH